MSDSELSNIVYTQDDELRYKEIVAQIHRQKAHTRRKSILGAAEIIRVLKTKKHEYDCFGNSLINFLYGVEVVRILKTLNVSYVEDTEEVFKDNLRKEIAYAFHKRDEFIKTLVERKANLLNTELNTLRTEVLEDIKSSEDLIKTRFSSFFKYFQMILKMHRDIAAIVEVSEEMKIIRSRLSTVMIGLLEKKNIITHISLVTMLEYLSDDVDHAIEVLNCQADSLLQNILVNIADLNNLLGTEDVVGLSSSESRSSGSGGIIELSQEEEEEESTSSKEEKDELASTTESEYGTEDDVGAGELGYLMDAVGKPLIQSLTHCVLRHPVDPICFVSGFMRNYRMNEEKVERKSEELKLLLAERERIQSIKKARQEEEERKRMEADLLLTVQPEGEE